MLIGNVISSASSHMQPHILACVHAGLVAHGTQVVSTVAGACRVLVLLSSHQCGLGRSPDPVGHFLTRYSALLSCICHIVNRYPHCVLLVHTLHVMWSCRFRGMRCWATMITVSCSSICRRRGKVSEGASQEMGRHQHGVNWCAGQHSSSLSNEKFVATAMQYETLIMSHHSARQAHLGVCGAGPTPPSRT
jgi:hypothetical protein